MYCDLHPLSVQCWSLKNINRHVSLINSNNWRTPKFTHGKEGNDKSYCVAHNLNRQASLPGISTYSYDYYSKSEPIDG